MSGESKTDISSISATAKPILVAQPASYSGDPNIPLAKVTTIPSTTPDSGDAFDEYIGDRLAEEAEESLRRRRGTPSAPSGTATPSSPVPPPLTPSGAPRIATMTRRAEPLRNARTRTMCRDLGCIGVGSAVGVGLGTAATALGAPAGCPAICGAAGMFSAISHLDKNKGGYKKRKTRRKRRRKRRKTRRKSKKTRPRKRKTKRRRKSKKRRSRRK